MVEWLKDGVFTIDEATAFIKSRVPNPFTEIYNRIFLQYNEDQHKYIRYEKAKCGLHHKDPGAILMAGKFTLFAHCFRPPASTLV